MDCPSPSERTVPAARIVFSQPDQDAIVALVRQALSTGALTLGPCTRDFEEAFATAQGSPFSVAVSSGTSALEIILRSLGVAGRQVIVPTNTFFATAAAVLHAGASVRLADVAPDTLSLSTGTIEAALTEETAAVVLVHIGGLVTPEVDAIAQLCRRRGLFLVEDAAHAHGAGYCGRSAGSFGIAGAFSFYPTKVVTSAEGGMIVTGERGLRDEALLYRDQGKASFLGGDHVRLGYAWRMSELEAAVGLIQLRHLGEFIATRQKAAAVYDEELADSEGITPLLPPPGCEPNYYKYVALLDPGIDRQQLKERLRYDHGVGLSGEVYASPLHRQPVFMGLSDASFPVAEDLCGRHVCLPIHSDMTREEAAYVASCVRTVLQRVPRGSE